MTSVEPTIKPTKTPFWGENPNVLFQSDQIFDFFPVETMEYNAKLNAVSRTVIFLTIFTFIITKSLRVLIVGLITLGAIYALHYYEGKQTDKRQKYVAENFDSPGIDVANANGLIQPNIFDAPSSSNPFSNVLMTDYEYNPDKPPAPPAFNTKVNDDILNSAKQAVMEANPDQPDIADKLFKDLGEELEFEQSMRQFYTNPGSTIPNDQTAFAEFCYGSMISCKEGNLFACARNLDRYQN
jgi:hypothetical protein